jgi:predicted kinase
MHQFSASALASDPLQMNRFTGDQLDDLAVRLAQFHQSIGRSSSANQRGGSRGAHRAVLENFAVIKERCADPNDLAHIASLECWMNDRMAKYADLLDRRSGAGAVRECHGDLHLGNLVVLDGMLVPFDCIEFSEELRWIDVMSEIAFLVMDLEFHGLRHLAWRFLNRYLTATGDYEGLPLLRYFLIYRAMVRAKIALLSAGTGIGEVEARQRFRPYLQYGMDLTKESAAGLMILHGFSGSGKSVLAGLIAEWLPAIWLRSDVERKRLAPQEDRPEQRYAPEQTERTYERLSQLAGVVVQSGYPVVVDATFLQSKYRQQMKMVASSCDAPFVIIDIQCPIVTMRQRVEERSRVGTDPSEATVAVLAHQLPSAEPLEPAENEVVWVVSGDTPFDRQAALSELRSRLRLND